MVTMLRVLARNALVTRFDAPIPWAAATSTLSTSCYRLTDYSSHGRRSLHTDTAPAVSSVAQQPQQQTSTSKAPLSQVSREENLLNPNWRHPRFGFAAADFGHLIYMKLPRTATENDVKALTARAGLQNTQVFMYYYFETGKPGDFCFLKIADSEKVDDAIAALSRFTLLGSELKPVLNSLWKAPAQDPVLLAGWLPSPSSDLSARVIRPPTTQPPKLLSTLMNGQWMLFTNIPVDLEDKDAPSHVAEALYQQFYSFDVLGVTVPRMHRAKGQYGVCCKMLFGSPLEAKSARKLHVASVFMGKPGQARTYRGGHDILKPLWNYRRSLPEDMPDEEVSNLLEERYRRIVANAAERQRRIDYPTPESAVGIKDS